MKEQIFGDAIIKKYDDKIVDVRHIENWDGEDNLDTAKTVIVGMKLLTAGDERKGLLITSPSLYKKQEILNLFHLTDVNDAARALVISSFAAKIVGNMYLKLAKNVPNENGRYVPAKLFTDREEAIKWLHEQVEADRKENSGS